jgi:hypothetical protein
MEFHIVYNHGIPQCAHSLNAPCLYIKKWPADGSLEAKHVANCVLIDYICVVVDWIYCFIILYNTAGRLLSKVFISTKRNEKRSYSRTKIIFSETIDTATLRRRHWRCNGAVSWADVG